MGPDAMILVFWMLSFNWLSEFQKHSYIKISVFLQAVVLSCAEKISPLSIDPNSSFLNHV